MTNLDIIKYLATNNPARLAQFLDDVWCYAWNSGASVQCLMLKGDMAKVEKRLDSELEFSESGWLNQAAKEYFFYGHELEEWSKCNFVDEPIKNCLNCYYLGKGDSRCDICDPGNNFEYFKFKENEL